MGTPNCVDDTGMALLSTPALHGCSVACTATVPYQPQQALATCVLMVMF